MATALVVLGIELRGMASGSSRAPMNAIAEGISASSEFLGQSADAMSTAGDTTQSTATAIQAYQDAVQGLRKTTGDGFNLLTSYQQNLTDADATAMEAESFCRKVSGGLRTIKVPSGVRFERLLPVVQFEVPSVVSEAAEQMLVIADRASNLSKSLRKSKTFLAAQKENQTALDVALAGTSRALADARLAVSQVGDDRLKHAASRLRLASEALKTTATQADSMTPVMKWIGDGLILTGAILVLNGIVPMLLLRQSDASVGGEG